jgi:hypothetical protein
VWHSTGRSSTRSAGGSPTSADGCLSSQSGVPGDLQLPPQAILKTNLVLNANQYRRPCAATRTTLGIRCRQSLQDGAGVVNARVDCHPVV